MLRFFRYGLPAVLFILVAVPMLVGGKSAPKINEAAVQAEFKAAIQRIRQHQPDQPDSSALKSYAIYDYLLVAPSAVTSNRSPAMTWTRQSTLFSKRMRESLSLATYATIG